MTLRDVKILQPLKRVKFLWLRAVANKKRKNLAEIKIESDFDTIVNKIITEKKSLARLGDGEIRIALGVDPEGFQENDERLRIRLREILALGDDENEEDFGKQKNGQGGDELGEQRNGFVRKGQNILIGINKALIEEPEGSFKSKYFWDWFSAKYLDGVREIINENGKYIDASFSRIYIRQRDREECKRKFAKMQEIWQGREIVFIEGEYSKLGVGNDLFSNAKSVRRIIAPAKNAFSCYDEILEEASKIDKKCLIIIALGATATVLAYDLAKCGYQALDLGHIDIEYEWYKMGAKKAEKVSGKYTNEVRGKEKIQGEITGEEREKYEEAIIARVGNRERAAMKRKARGDGGASGGVLGSGV